MTILNNISLPNEINPVRDVFSGGGKRDEGRCFLGISSMLGNLLEEMPDRDRRELYMDEIPPGRKVLHDLRKVHTYFSKEEAQDPDFRLKEFDWWAPPKGSWLVIYEHPIMVPMKTSEMRVRSHYLKDEQRARSDAALLSKAWGMKIAIAKVEWRMDWH